MQRNNVFFGLKARDTGKSNKVSRETVDHVDEINEYIFSCFLGGKINVNLSETLFVGEKYSWKHFFKENLLLGKVWEIFFLTITLGGGAVYSCS
jgi:hypothetical protein